MKTLLRSGVLALAIMALAVPVSAGPFEDGIAAYQGGDYETALKLWRPLAERGQANAQFNLGVMFDEGRGVSQDYAEAVKWYQKAAEQGVAYAQNNLGAMYANGQGVTQDYGEAAKWYRTSAEQGYARAKNSLGVSYAIGRRSSGQRFCPHVVQPGGRARARKGARRPRDSS